MRIDDWLDETILEWRRKRARREPKSMGELLIIGVIVVVFVLLALFAPPIIKG
jgi:hypothetical protein